MNAMNNSLIRFIRVMILFVVGNSTVSYAQDEPQKRGRTQESGFSITISGEVDAKLASVAGKLVTLFYESYPKLVKRFEHPDKAAPRNIRLIFSTKIRVPAYCTGREITVSVNWLKKHPEDIGLLTHELTHSVQAYQRGPSWMTEGIADYARHLYGPKEQPGWELPRRLTKKQSYRNSYRITGRFLLWLDEQHPGVVDKLHRKLQDREFEITDFKNLTGKTVDELWEACVAKLNGVR